MSQATAVAERQDAATAVVAERPAGNPVMDMIREAVAKGQPLDVIRELKDLAKELAADEAARAFTVAFAAFKGEVVRVDRNREVTDGPLKGRRYAELFSFVNAATPALSKHGLSASWTITKDDKDWIEVTCTLEHALGGKKLVSVGGPLDTGGAKNALQARISTITYLERVTFKAACGLAEQGDDDDGAAAGAGDVINDEDRKTLLKLIDDHKADVTKFCKYFHVASIAMLPASKFAQAKEMIEAKGK